MRRFSEKVATADRLVTICGLVIVPCQSARLDHARQALKALDDEDLSIRRGREIQGSLMDYIKALAETTVRLQALCQSQAPERATNDRIHGDEPSALKIAYDDAVQNHRRCGSRLNELISTL